MRTSVGSSRAGLGTSDSWMASLPANVRAFIVAVAASDMLIGEGVCGSNWLRAGYRCAAAAAASSMLMDCCCCSTPQNSSTTQMIYEGIGTLSALRFAILIWFDPLNWMRPH